MLAALRANIAATILGALAAIFAICAVVQSVKLNGFLWIDGANDRIEKLERDNNELRAGVKAAEELNRQQVERITNEQQEVTNDIEAKYEADLARLRAELGKRLQQPAPPRNPAGPQAGPDGATPGKPDEAAKVCIPTGDYVRGAETELQLDTLITWIEEQLKVRR